MVRRTIAYLAVALAGALFGPFLYAAAANIGGTQGRWDDIFAAQRLIEIVDRHAPRHGLVQFTTVVEPDTDRSCGYAIAELPGSHDLNPRIVLNPALNDRWTPTTGYQDLLDWKTVQRENLDRWARAKVLAQRLSIYPIRVMADCIDHTALSPICASYVRAVLSPGGYDRKVGTIDQTRENTTICTYLDGIATQSGKPLASRIPAPSK